MKSEQAIKLIEVIKEIVAALHREMGTGWCGTTIDKLNNIQSKIEPENN